MVARSYPTLRIAHGTKRCWAVTALVITYAFRLSPLILPTYIPLTANTNTTYITTSPYNVRAYDSFI